MVELSSASCTYDTITVRVSERGHTLLIFYFLHLLATEQCCSPCHRHARLLADRQSGARASSHASPSEEMADALRQPASATDSADRLYPPAYFMHGFMVWERAPISAWPSPLCTFSRQQS